MNIAFYSDSFEVLSVFALLLCLRDNALGAPREGFVVTYESVRGWKWSHPRELIALSHPSLANPPTTGLLRGVWGD